MINVILYKSIKNKQNLIIFFNIFVELKNSIIYKIKYYKL